MLVSVIKRTEASPKHFLQFSSAKLDTFTSTFATQAELASFERQSLSLARVIASRPWCHPGVLELNQICLTGIVGCCARGKQVMLYLNWAIMYFKNTAY
jgi:hypothetical protein